MTKDGIGLYEKAMPNTLTVEQKLLLTRECGFDGMEISIDETPEKLGRIFSRQETAAIGAAMRSTGVPIRTMCLSGHRRYPLGETDPRGMEIMTAAVDFAGELGIRIIQLAGYDTYYHESTPETRARFAENLRRSVDYAAKNGVLLAFETMETDFMNTCAKAMAYVGQVRSPYLQIYPDLGNIRNATEDYLGDLRCAAGHIAAVHLKETAAGRYRDMEYGQGRVDFAGCIRTLREMGVHRYTCEFWYDGKTDPKEYILRNKQYIDHVFRTVAEEQ